MYELHIANKNYSSWSLRPWALMRALDIPFAERLHRLGAAGEFRSYGVAPGDAAGDYLAHLLAHPAMSEWEAAALAEDFREPEHEAELAAAGRVTADFRAAARA